MLLILMRHGIAEDGAPDEARRLTPKGRARVRLMASLLERLDIAPDLVLSSPRVRARQTAEIVAKSLGGSVPLQITEALDFQYGWREVAEDLNARLASLDASATVLACGHQPQFGRLVTAAIFGEERDMDIRKASLAGIRFPGEAALGHGELRFYLTPSTAKSAKL